MTFEEWWKMCEPISNVFTSKGLAHLAWDAAIKYNQIKPTTAPDRADEKSIKCGTYYGKYCSKNGPCNHDARIHRQCVFAEAE